MKPCDVLQVERVVASRSALFAVACYCVTECTVCSGVLLPYTLDDQPVCALPVRPQCAHDVMLRRESAAVVAVEKQCVLHIVSVCL